MKEKEQRGSGSHSEKLPIAFGLIGTPISTFAAWAGSPGLQ